MSGCVEHGGLENGEFGILLHLHFLWRNMVDPDRLIKCVVTGSVEGYSENASSPSCYVCITVE